MFARRRGWQRRRQEFVCIVSHTSIFFFSGALYISLVTITVMWCENQSREITHLKGFHILLIIIAGTCRIAEILWFTFWESYKLYYVYCAMRKLHSVRVANFAYFKKLQVTYFVVKVTSYYLLEGKKLLPFFGR